MTSVIIITGCDELTISFTGVTAETHSVPNQLNRDISKQSLQMITAQRFLCPIHQHR